MILTGVIPAARNELHSRLEAQNFICSPHYKLYDGPLIIRPCVFNVSLIYITGIPSIQFFFRLIVLFKRLLISLFTNKNGINRPDICLVQFSEDIRCLFLRSLLTYSEFYGPFIAVRFINNNAHDYQKFPEPLINY